MANENKFGLSKDRLHSKGLVLVDREGVHCKKEDAFTVRSELGQKSFLLWRGVNNTRKNQV